MNISEMDLKLMIILQEWDPFDKGEEGYDHEIAEVIQSVHELHHPTDLARHIQAIYESAFGQWIPLQDCTKVSYKLLAVKMDAVYEE
ncbi:DUF1871 family protein [Jeotgalibacillus sp. R-1-5s-1]|uniref:DUF1871 family protein n=1 Tax=Jeotgalibacillus sp. R-1-5s-1 TaxID=2555897 RepID=UPI00106B8A78|nr:DUF1871 family protein [Jeotgalibacillus sp. R-1-5s-1]TFD95949.1 DUF1871 family protein [Jeotgalibacillus sp. R-1-5s-1]